MSYRKQIDEMNLDVRDLLEWRYEHEEKRKLLNEKKKRKAEKAKRNFIRRQKEEI